MSFENSLQIIMGIKLTVQKKCQWQSLTNLSQAVDHNTFSYRWYRISWDLHSLIPTFYSFRNRTVYCFRYLWNNLKFIGIWSTKGTKGKTCDQHGTIYGKNQRMLKHFHLRTYTHNHEWLLEICLMLMKEWDIVYQGFLLFFICYYTRCF